MIEDPLKLYRGVLMVAWEKGNVLPGERAILEKLRSDLGISQEAHMDIEFEVTKEAFAKLALSGQGPPRMDAAGISLESNEFDAGWDVDIPLDPSTPTPPTEPTIHPAGAQPHLASVEGMDLANLKAKESLMQGFVGHSTVSVIPPTAPAQQPSGTPAASGAPAGGDLDSWAAAIEKGNPSAALTSLESYLLACPDDVRGRLLFAKALHGVGQSERALAELEKVLAKDPNHIEAIELQSAIEDAVRIVKLQLDGILERVNELKKEERFEEALEVFGEAEAIAPGNPKVLRQKGLVLERLGRTQEALQAFEEAIRLDPNDKNVWYYKGTLLLNMGNYSQALECFERTIRLTPKHKKAWIGKGEALYALGRKDQARKAFEHVGICGFCKGTGKCLDCNGTGKCPECDGTGKCFSCEGTGKAFGAACDLCRGTGRCDFCSGSGKCPTCGGKLKCTHCKGTGVFKG